MNPTVAGLILLSAILHVSWNTLGKSGTPSAAFFFTASLSSVIVLLPLLILLKFDFQFTGKYGVTLRFRAFV